MSEGDRAPGLCYKEAYEIAQRLGAELVHGYPRLSGGPHKGRLYGHAWAELQRMVFTLQDGEERVFDRQIYYHVGQIDEALCRRYTPSEARERLLAEKHWGPWEVPDGLPEEPLFAGEEKARGD